ncbi:MAG: hypothetical protein U0414_23045 [Polyangiaceae bacterium]
MIGVSRFGTHAHPGLEKDLFAGADVSPKRRLDLGLDLTARTPSRIASAMAAPPRSRGAEELDHTRVLGDPLDEAGP